MEYLEAELFDTVVGGGGTTDYERLRNKPMVNGVELVGDKSSEELGIATKTSDLTNDGDGTSPFATLDDVAELDTGATTVAESGDGNAYTGASYNSETKTITFSKDETFQTAFDNGLETTSKSVVGAINEVKGVADGNARDIGTINGRISALDSGKEDVIGADHKINADYVDDSSAVNKFVTAAEKSQISTNQSDIAGLQSLKQDKTDNSLATDSKTVVGAINEVNSVAKGATKAKGFADYQSLITYLNSAGAGEFLVGQSFYVQTKYVPDLWVLAVESSSVVYTYTTDGAFILATEAVGGQQVGYYRLAQLETQKVDLSGYVEKTTSVAGIDLQDNITVAEMQNALSDSTHRFVTDAEKAGYEGKADKVSGAVQGNFAGLDGNGNLTDSGKSAADYYNKTEVDTVTSGKQDITLSGTSDPTTNTVGTVNQLYRNTTTNKVFICTAVTAQGTDPETYSYTWSEVGGSVDQTYDPTSINAQSGVAVASAIAASIGNVSQLLGNTEDL